jgi:uncharacterized membrane protein
MDDRYSTPPVRPNSAGGFQLNKPTIVSLCYMIGPLTAGLVNVLGLILAYVWRGSPAEMWEESHFRFHIRSFWYAVVASILAIPLWVIGLRWLAVIAIGLWFVARAFLALMQAQKDQPVPNPETLFW